MRLHKILIPTTILLASAAVTAAASAGPTLKTNQACYLVGQPVAITGAGFAPARRYEVALDGGNFGLSTTDATGGFTAKFRPGGVPAGQAQVVHHLTATDGTTTTNATFTITRKTGAFVSVGSGPAKSVRARFEAWGFALKNNRPQPSVPGRPAPQVYVHYVNPRGKLIMSTPLGRAGGQCGYVKSGSKPLFGFSPGPGAWTLQFDTSFRYSKHPKGPKAYFGLRVR